jgi:hypothetical protein
MKLIPLILHFNTKEHTENLCRELPEAVVIANCEKCDLNVPNQIITLGQNYGFSNGWNMGLFVALRNMPDVTHFWLCNSDIIPYKDCFQKLSEFIETSDLGIITANYNCWNEEVRHKDCTGPRLIKFIEFTAPVISRQTFEQIGYFDSENFSHGYGTEYDFCHRAAKAYIKAGIYDHAEFYHMRKQSIIQLPDQQQYEKEGVRQQTKLYAKHKSDNIFGSIHFKENRNQRAAVYTTIFGKYDILRSIPDQSVDVDYFCICDLLPDSENQEATEQWKIIQVPWRDEYKSERMQAKHYKCCPYDCGDLRVYDNLIYIDASIKVKDRDFVRFSLASLTDARFTVSIHKERRSIFEEAKFSARMPKYDDQPVINQAETYRNSGFADQVPLFECGYLVRNMRSKKVQELCRTWLRECCEHTYQDQISLPFVCWIYRFAPANFTVGEDYRNIYDNKYIKVLWNPKK